jgi:hypothetical protein
MGVQKPQASKAPAFVAPPLFVPPIVNDPCCIPAGVETQGPLGSSMGSDSSLGRMDDGLGHIMQPTAH